MKKQLEADIILSAFSKAKKLEGKVWIEFTWHEKTKRRDKDNVCGMGKKCILDSMQKKGILENDNNQCVEGFVDRFVYGKEDKVDVRVFADRRK